MASSELAISSVAAADGIPSVDDIKAFLCEESFYCRDYLKFMQSNTHLQIIVWFITTQRDAWVKSGRQFTTFEELVFGVPDPSTKKQLFLVHALYYYHDFRLGPIIYPDTEFGKISSGSPFWKYQNAPALPDSYIQDVRMYFPGMPEHFIQVCHAHFLEMGSRFQNVPFISIAPNTLLTFFMVCIRSCLPNEIIHAILLNVGIDIFRATPGSVNFLDSGKKFTDALDFFTKSISLPQVYELRIWDITKMTSAFSEC